MISFASLTIPKIIFRISLKAPLTLICLNVESCVITSPASRVVRKTLHWVFMNDLKRVFLNVVVVSLGLNQAEDHLVFRVTTSADSRNNVIIVELVHQLAFLADPFI